MATLAAANRSPSFDETTRESKWEILTAQFLAMAWRTLIVSFGATLLYINLHFLGRYFAQSTFFSPFGQFLRFGASRVGGKPAEIVEIMLLVLLDGILIAALIVLVSVILVFVREMFCSFTRFLPDALITLVIPDAAVLLRACGAS